MQRHQLLVTPPQQAGKRARREIVVDLGRSGGGGGGGVDRRWVGGLDCGGGVKGEGVTEGIMNAVISFV